MKQFNVIAATFYEHYDEILNFYNNRSSNAVAESFNAKINFSGRIYTELPTKSSFSSESQNCMVIPTDFLLLRVPVAVSVWGNEKAPDKGRGQPKSFHNGIILIVICFKLVCQR